MTVALQVSDPHFGTERPMAMAALRRLCAGLRPDLLLVTGDITQRARAIEFSKARAFFDTLDVPSRLIVPGNHDIPLFDIFTRAFRPYSRYLRASGPALEGSSSATTCSSWRSTPRGATDTSRERCRRRRLTRGP